MVCMDVLSKIPKLTPAADPAGSTSYLVRTCASDQIRLPTGPAARQAGHTAETCGSRNGSGSETASKGTRAGNLTSGLCQRHKSRHTLCVHMLMGEKKAHSSRTPSPFGSTCPNLGPTRRAFTHTSQHSCTNTHTLSSLCTHHPPRRSAEKAKREGARA